MKEKRYNVLLIGSSSPHVANHLMRIIGGPFNIEVITDSNRFLDSNQKWTKISFVLSNIFNWFTAIKIIRQKIIGSETDVIHVHQANSVAFFSVLANRKRKLPIVLTAWGSDILINPKKFFLLRYMVKFILKRVTFITSDSEFMAQEIRKLVPSLNPNITICNFGVEESTIPIVKLNIIYSNRSHNPLYRIQEVIKGFDQFINSNPKEDWKLIVAGAGSETIKLKALVDKFNLSEKVQFVGFVNSEENAGYYSSAKFFVSLPESDATAMSLLEAMYYKCIPILSDLPANNEWVKNGVNGVIVKNLNSEYLSEALLLDAVKVGEENRTIILKSGTIEISENKFQDVLIKACVK